MKLFILAALLALFLAPLARAEEKPFVRVQILYVDAAIPATERANYAPPPNVSVGDALASLTTNLKNGTVPYNVTSGPDITSLNGLLYASNGLSLAPATGIELNGPDVFLGPAVIMTPTVGKDDLVSVDLHLMDKEIASLPGRESAIHEIVEASVSQSFQAQSGSTIYLGDSFGVHGMGRFTFAKVTIIPPGFPVPGLESPYSIVLIDSHTAAKD